MGKVPKADFCIVVDFKKGSEHPERIYQALVETFKSFNKVDKILLNAVDSSVEPVLTLEDIEIGSIRNWVSQILKNVPDDSLNNLDLRPLLGQYLVKGKQLLIKWCEGKTQITDRSQIKEIQNDLSQLAHDTGISPKIGSSAIPEIKIIEAVRLISVPLEYLNKEDKMYYETNDGQKATFNMELKVAPESMEELITKEVIESEMTKILHVKKPDYLGNSMWEFKDENKIIPAKILDQEWVGKFQARKIDVRPGDALKVKVKIIVKYGHDNEVVSTVYEIIEIKDILRPENESPSML